jgi:hypothetical protein
MRPAKSAQGEEQGDLYQRRLSTLLDQSHPLYVLAEAIEWQFFEQEFGALNYGVGDPDRFGAARLAGEVDARVSEALRDLNPKVRGFFPEDGGRNRERHWQSFGNPINYEQVLITGERGSLKFVDGRYTGTEDAEQNSFMSLVWYELQYASDEELQELRNWNEAQAYLSIVAAARVRDDRIGPNEVQVPGGLVLGPGPKRLPSMKRSRVIKIGKTHVTSERWKALLQNYVQRSVAEREAALQGVRDWLSQSMSLYPDELSLLIAAAVADYETDRDGTNLITATKRIKDQRRVAQGFAAGRFRESVLEASGRGKRSEGWLGPAMRRLGLPEGLSAFSEVVLEAAAEKRLLRVP